MSIDTQFRALSSRGAAMRQSMFGQDAEGAVQTIDYDDGAAQVDGYFTAIRFEHQIDGLNLQQVHNCVVRIRKAQATPFTPQFGKTLTLTGLGLKLRIEEVSPDHPAAVEWVLGCKQL